MPEIVLATPENLREVLEGLKPRIPGTPVYRALHRAAADNFRETGSMPVQEGCGYSVGRGVFFYLDQAPILNYEKNMVVVGSLEMLSAGRKLVDTRIEGCELEAIEILTRERGVGKFSVWNVWAKVLENDTISNVQGAKGFVPVYTRRIPVRSDELLFEVRT